MISRSKFSAKKITSTPGSRAPHRAHGRASARQEEASAASTGKGNEDRRKEYEVGGPTVTIHWRNKERRVFCPNLTNANLRSSSSSSSSSLAPRRPVVLCRRHPWQQRMKLTSFVVPNIGPKMGLRMRDRIVTNNYICNLKGNFFSLRTKCTNMWEFSPIVDLFKSYIKVHSHLVLRTLVLSSLTPS